MAKLSRRAPSSAATPSTATTTQTTTETKTTTVNHDRSEGEQQLQRIARASSLYSSASASSNNQRNSQFANFVDPNANVAAAAAAAEKALFSASGSASASAASSSSSAYSSYNSNSKSNTASTTPPPVYAHARTTAPVTATPYMPLLPPGERNLTDAENAAERARVRQEFFATYDVMTGVRIAATLGGFFGLMVFLIVWKSRSSSNETLKVLKDPKMAAVAAVCMQEEEERELQEAIVATGMSIYPDEYDALVYRRQRMLSLGNVSAPPLLNRGYRCASVGGVAVPGAVGYSYLLEPPRRFSYSALSAGSGGPGAPGRRKSGSESSRIFSNYPMGGSFGTDDYFIETEDELDNEECMQRDAPDEHEQLHQRTDSTRSKPGFLSVPMAGHDSRRSSAMTCCSTDSSYLERRTSAYTLGMTNLPPTLQRKLSTASRASSIENWDYYYPDIQVIQPTPKASPCPSERSIHEPTPPQGKSKRESPLSTGLSAPSFKRKHSIVSYDPDSAHSGRKQQIHSISADTVDVYPYNQTNLSDGLDLVKPVQSAPPLSHSQQTFQFCESPSEELRLGVGRKLTLVELQRNVESNNNSYPYTANAAAPVAGTGTGTAPTTTTCTSSSISVDSTPVSLDRNGSTSLGTLSAAKVLQQALLKDGKRAPLASLSSFKISSLECADSELRSLDEDSVFGLEEEEDNSIADDTDDDMQQLSSDSDEHILAMTPTVATPTSSSFVPQLPIKRLSMSGTRPRRPLLQRHRTIGNCSSSNPTPRQPPPMAPLETHFGNVISSPPQRRGQLMQQLSDPQTTPSTTTTATTTTTTTTTTTEEDTCSTLNTELGMLEVQGGGTSPLGGGGEESTQYSSLNTVISVGQSSPSPHMDNMLLPGQLPTNCNRVGHDPSASSISDSVIASLQPQSICMPNSLKELILRGGSGASSGSSKSAHNLSLHSGEMSSATAAVMLELPLIRLPTDEDDEYVNEENDEQEKDEDDAKSDDSHSRDPSLPGSTRKWSKETLF